MKGLRAKEALFALFAPLMVLAAEPHSDRTPRLSSQELEIVSPHSFSPVRPLIPFAWSDVIDDPPVHKLPAESIPKVPVTPLFEAESEGVLGRGCFGEVHKVIGPDGQRYAVKIPKQTLRKSAYEDSLRRLQWQEMTPTPNYRVPKKLGWVSVKLADGRSVIGLASEIAPGQPIEGLRPSTSSWGEKENGALKRAADRYVDFVIENYRKGYAIPDRNPGNLLFDLATETIWSIDNDLHVPVHSKQGQHAQWVLKGTVEDMYNLSGNRGAGAAKLSQLDLEFAKAPLTEPIELESAKHGGGRPPISLFDSDAPKSAKRPSAPLDVECDVVPDTPPPKGVGSHSTKGFLLRRAFNGGVRPLTPAFFFGTALDQMQRKVANQNRRLDEARQRQKEREVRAFVMRLAQAHGVDEFDFSKSVPRDSNDVLRDLAAKLFPDAPERDRVALALDHFADLIDRRLPPPTDPILQIGVGPDDWTHRNEKHLYNGEWYVIANTATGMLDERGKWRDTPIERFLNESKHGNYFYVGPQGASGDLTATELEKIVESRKAAARQREKDILALADRIAAEARADSHRAQAARERPARVLQNAKAVFSAAKDRMPLPGLAKPTESTRQLLALGKRANDVKSLLAEGKFASGVASPEPITWILAVRELAVELRETERQLLTTPAPTASETLIKAKQVLEAFENETGITRAELLQTTPAQIVRAETRWTKRLSGVGPRGNESVPH